MWLGVAYISFHEKYKSEMLRFIKQTNDKDNQPMIRHTQKLTHITPALAAMLPSADAIANAPIGTITYGSLAQSIPTLSGFMLVILGLLLQY